MSPRATCADCLRPIVDGERNVRHGHVMCPECCDDHLETCDRCQGDTE